MLICRGVVVDMDINMGSLVLMFFLLFMSLLYFFIAFRSLLLQQHCFLALAQFDNVIYSD